MGLEHTLSVEEQRMREQLCLPLDGLETLEAVRERIEELSPYVGVFKIGKELYTRFGPQVIDIVHDNESQVFLDLKYHDIPNTVKGAAKAAAEKGVYMFNVHASGGSEMMEAAMQGAYEGTKIRLENLGIDCDDKVIKGEMPRVIGVTVLTSLKTQHFHEEGVDERYSLQDIVNWRAADVYNCNLHGIVCGGADVGAVKKYLEDMEGLTPSKGFLFVTPGIKGVNTPAGADQKRVYTPGNAIEDGSSILVVGRAITGPATREERQQAAYDTLQDMVRGEQRRRAA